MIVFGEEGADGLSGDAPVVVLQHFKRLETTIPQSRAIPNAYSKTQGQVGGVQTKYRSRARKSTAGVHPFIWPSVPGAKPEASATPGATRDGAIPSLWMCGDTLGGVLTPDISEGASS